MEDGDSAVATDPATERARRARLIAARDEIRLIRARILARRGGVPIDVQSVLDELRGRTDESGSH